MMFGLQMGVKYFFYNKNNTILSLTVSTVSKY